MRSQPPHCDLGGSETEFETFFLSSSQNCLFFAVPCPLLHENQSRLDGEACASSERWRLEWELATWYEGPWLQLRQRDWRLKICLRGRQGQPRTGQMEKEQHSVAGNVKLSLNASQEVEDGYSHSPSRPAAFDETCHFLKLSEMSSLLLISVRDNQRAERSKPRR